MKSNWYLICFPDNGQGAAMSGPYSSRESADAMARRVKSIADDIDGRTWFYRWHTALLEREKPGVLEQLGYLTSESKR